LSSIYWNNAANSTKGAQSLKKRDWRDEINGSVISEAEQMEV
jgi:hypothetical protein